MHTYLYAVATHTLRHSRIHTLTHTRPIARCGFTALLRMERSALDAALHRAALVEAMVENPILIERPIVVNGDKVALGRPPENVLGIL